MTDVTDRITEVLTGFSINPSPRVCGCYELTPEDAARVAQQIAAVLRGEYLPAGEQISIGNLGAVMFPIGQERRAVYAVGETIETALSEGDEGMYSRDEAVEIALALLAAAERVDRSTSI